MHAFDGRTDGQTDRQKSHRKTATAFHAARYKTFSAIPTYVVNIFVHPQSGEKNWGQVYRRKLQVHPNHPLPRQIESPMFFKEIWGIWTVRLVNLVVLACVLRATTKEKVNFFKEEKREILATPV